MKVIQYMGSKTNLLTNIEAAMRNYFGAEYEKQEFMFDIFSGSGAVANHFKNQFNLITNDKQAFTKVINDANLKNRYKKEHFEKLINELNNLPEEYFYKTDGWFTKTYAQDYNNGSAVGEDGVRKVFLTKNGKKLDMIRHKIDELYNNEKIDKDEKNVLLVCLLSAVDKITNTIGHQNGYLKNWSRKSMNDLTLTLPEISISNKFSLNLNADVESIVPYIETDIMYIDPPYGKSNGGTGTRYSSFYHLHNTIVENSRPEIFGKVSKPVKTRVSDRFEGTKRNEVMKLMTNLLKKSQAKSFVISYSTTGLLTVKDFEKVFELAGCDIDSLQLYTMNHTLNNQSKAAAKSITETQLVGSVTELLFIVKMQNKNRYADECIHQEIETYLSNYVESEISFTNAYVVDNGICSLLERD